jgi:hypothetical protein
MLEFVCWSKGKCQVKFTIPTSDAGEVRQKLGKSRLNVSDPDEDEEPFCSYTLGSGSAILFLDDSL